MYKTPPLTTTCLVQFAPSPQGTAHIRSIKGGSLALDTFLASEPSPPPGRTDKTPANARPTHIKRSSAATAPPRPRKRSATQPPSPLRAPQARRPPPSSPARPSRRAQTDLLRIIKEEGDPDRDSIPRAGPYASLVPPSSPWNNTARDMIGLHTPSGRVISPTLISPERYKWLHAAHSQKGTTGDFTQDLLQLLARYNPRAKSLNPQGRKLKLANHWAIPPSLRVAMEKTFLTTTELFGSPLNCSMTEGITYCSAFKGDANFGAIINSFSYRWTASCIANPEYEPEDMLQAILHALASSENTDTPFLVVMILPIWDDTPWRSNAISGHPNMSTLIRIPTGHMRFVPAQNQADDPEMELKPAKWPVELVLIANNKGKEAYLDNGRIHTILSPAIQATCHLNEEDILFFPQTPHLGHLAPLNPLTPPRRTLPACPAVATTTGTTGTTTPTRGQLTEFPPHTMLQEQSCPAPTTLSIAREGYTSSQPIPPLESLPTIPGGNGGSPPPSGPPIPHPWTPMFTPEHWIYTDGSDIDGHPRLGAAVIHIPTSTTLYIDAAGTEETRTIMRAELVAIHTALTVFSTHEWIGIFTDSLSSLQAIEHHHTNPGICTAKYYHHHMLLLESITDLLEARRQAGQYTTLHKIRAHTNIRGNDLADAAAKLAVRSFDTLPPDQTIRVDIGGIAPRPKHWVMYTANPPPLRVASDTSRGPSTTRRPWWTIPEAERLQMHAFTRPSHQLRQKVRQALLRDLHHTSLYRRLIVANKGLGARLHTVGEALHKRLNSNPKEGTTLLKFVYGQLYNGKIAKRFGHTPTDDCPLCHKPDSCTHIAGECQEHEGLRIARHNAACQLIHAAIRTTSKGGGALHSTPDLILVAADTGTLPQTSGVNMPPPRPPPSSQEENPPPTKTTPGTDWLAPMPSPNRIAHMRHTDVSQEMRYNLSDLAAAAGDTECTTAPRRIPSWVLSPEELQELYSTGHGTAPDLIYARGVPDSPSPDPTTFNKKTCTLIIIELGFCRDLGCEDKRAAKTKKYDALVAALKRHWGRVEFIAFPIGHAGTTLTSTLNDLTAAFSTTRPRETTTGATRDTTGHDVDHTARSHDYNLFKSLLTSLTDLAQSRLIGIINNRKRLIASPPGNARRNRANSDATLAPSQAVTQQETATHTHRTRTTRIPESTAII